MSIQKQTNKMNKKLQEQKHKVKVTDLDLGNTAIYNSISQARRELGFSRSSIYRSIKTGNQISKNKAFKFENVK